MNATPTLSELVKASAERMKDVYVDADTALGTVTISSAGEDDIFLDGDDAEQFFAAVDKLYKETGDCPGDQCARHVAEPYVESLWN